MTIWVKKRVNLGPRHYKMMMIKGAEESCKTVVSN